MTLDNPNPYGTSQDDRFGRSIGISGNYAIVGADQEDDSGGTESGKAYLFPLSFVLDRIDQIELSDKTFLNKDNIAFKNASFNATKLLHTLDNPNAYDTSAYDQFGQSVAISGNYAIGGAVVEDDAGGTGSGRAYIFNVTTGAVVCVLNNPNPYGTSLNDFFGSSVAIDGNYAIVGAYFEDDSGGTSSGKAYIFNVTTGALLHTLDNSNAYSTSFQDYFGWSVAISGNYAIVSAYFEDDTGGGASGKAYIFNVTTGALLHTLNNPNAYGTSVSDNFGYSVGISGNYAIVGAYLEDDTGGSQSGKAYIFELTAGPEEGRSFTVTNDGTSNYIIEGASNPTLNLLRGFTYTFNINASGHPFYIQTVSGAYSSGNVYNDGITGNGTESGTLTFTVPYNAPNTLYYVCQNHSSMNGTINISDRDLGFALIHTLDNPNAYSTSLNDRFGQSVAISGNYAIVGAYLEDDAGGSDSGKAYIFNVTTGALVHTLDNPNAYGTSAEDQFGVSVAIDGNYCIVGAYQEDDAGGTQSGKAYIFNVTTGALVYTLDNPNAYGTSVDDNFGYSVGMSGNYAIVGAYLEDESGGLSSGKTYMYYIDTNASKNRTVFDKLITLF